MCSNRSSVDAGAVAGVRVGQDRASYVVDRSMRVNLSERQGNTVKRVASVQRPSQRTMANELSL
jgi:hypothetical protein